MTRPSQADSPCVHDYVRCDILRDMTIRCLINTIELGEMLFLVLEYCDRGDLEAYRQAHGTSRNRLLVATARDFAWQLAEGLKVLRGERIVHRDLKPQVKFPKDRNERLKLESHADSVSSEMFVDYEDRRLVQTPPPSLVAL